MSLPPPRCLLFLFFVHAVVLGALFLLMHPQTSESLQTDQYWLAALKACFDLGPVNNTGMARTHLKPVESRWIRFGCALDWGGVFPGKITKLLFREFVWFGRREQKLFQEGMTRKHQWSCEVQSNAWLWRATAQSSYLMLSLEIQHKNTVGDNYI